MTTTDVPPLQVTPQCRRDNGFATMINMNRLRELTAELGFIPATTDAAAIDGRERQIDPQIAERGPGVSTGDRPLRRSAHFDDIGGHPQTGQKMAWLGKAWVQPS